MSVTAARTESSSPFGIGLLGCGRISVSHLEGLKSMEGKCRLLAVCDHREARARDRAEAFGCPHVYSDLEQLLENKEIDVVLVLTPPGVRLEVVQPLLEAGKHLLVEKPFAESFAEAVEMVDLADSLGLRLAVNQNFRWLPESRKVKEILGAGGIGHPLFMLQNHSQWRDEQEGWRNATERLALAVMGVHWLDRFRWLMGQEAHSVYCASMFSGLLSSEGEDLATMVIEFRNGCLSNLTEHWCSHSQRGANFFQLDGTDGSLLIRGEKLVHYDAGGELADEWPAIRDLRQTFAASLEELLDAIRDGREPSHSARDNLGTMALLDGAYRSSAEGTKIELETNFGV